MKKNKNMVKLRVWSTSEAAPGAQGSDRTPDIILVKRRSKFLIVSAQAASLRFSD